MLFALAALSVDLGNAYVHNKDIQKTADFAALAGGQGDNLPGTAGGLPCGYGTAARETDQAIKDVAEYLSKHYATVQPSALVNCSFDDGEAAYGSFRRNGATGRSLPT